MLQTTPILRPSSHLSPPNIKVFATASNFKNDYFSPSRSLVSHSLRRGLERTLFSTSELHGRLLFHQIRRLEAPGRLIANVKGETTSSGSDVELAVFRFTLGIPGFDDADLPRVIGLVAGILIILNHFLSLDSLTNSQWRSEGVGLFLASVAIAIPELGKRMKEARGVRERGVLAEGPQIFALDESLGEEISKELAWTSYALLRNSAATAVMIYSEELGFICIRGFLTGSLSLSPSLSLDSSTKKKDILKESTRAMKKVLATSNALRKVISGEGEREALYIPEGGQQWEFLPRDTTSVLVQPIRMDYEGNSKGGEKGGRKGGEGGRKGGGALILISPQPRAWGSKDRIWVDSLAKKLGSTLVL